MKRITINKSLSSNLRPEFNSVAFIDIEDKPFAVGGFGEVYHCISIDGKMPSVNQVVKLFIDNAKGSDVHNYKTTQKLQKKIDAENNKILSASGATLTENFPAFKGVPQLSFEGHINGQKYLGFTSDNLVSLGFMDFEHFFQDISSLMQYQQFPLQKKMLLAYQLVSAFEIFEDFYFIHADLKPGSLFINLAACEIAIIDFDSGVITENSNDEPLTWGAANDWVAPEIWEQQSTIQKGEKIRVDVYSDRWSVTIGIHYLITTFHPLFYLTELSPRIAKQYFKPPNQWPEVNTKAPYFEKSNEAIYKQYLPWMQNVVPRAVRDKLFNTINYGYIRPVARTPYTEWKHALRSVQQPAVIKSFVPTRSYIINGMDTELSWEVENAHTVEINNGIGVVSPIGKKTVKPHSTIPYKIMARGYFGNDEREIMIDVYPPPVIETLKVPTPDFTSRINVSALSQSPPNINFSVSLPDLRTTPRKYPDAFIDLKTIKKMQKPKWTIFGISEIYERIRQKLST